MYIKSRNALQIYSQRQQYKEMRFFKVNPSTSPKLMGHIVFVLFHASVYNILGLLSFCIVIFADPRIDCLYSFRKDAYSNI